MAGVAPFIAFSAYEYWGYSVGTGVLA
jgi:hypothetical protein